MIFFLSSLDFSTVFLKMISSLTFFDFSAQAKAPIQIALDVFKAFFHNFVSHFSCFVYLPFVYYANILNVNFCVYSKSRFVPIFVISFNILMNVDNFSFQLYT